MDVSHLAGAVDLRTHVRIDPGEVEAPAGRRELAREAIEDLDERRAQLRATTDPQHDDGARRLADLRQLLLDRRRPA